MDVPPPHRASRRLHTSALPIAFETAVPGLLSANVRGKVDAAGARELQRRVQHELLHRQPHLLVIELSGVRFLGLHGIAVLERFRRRATGDRHEVALGADSPAAERALRLAGVLTRFERAGSTWTGRPLGLRPCPCGPAGR